MLEKQKLMTHSATLEKQMEDMRATHRSKELNIGDLETRHKDVLRDNETLSEELKNVREKLNKGNAQLTRLQKEHDQLKDKHNKERDSLNNVI